MKTITSLKDAEVFLEHFESELIPLKMIEKGDKIKVSLALNEMMDIFYNEN